MTPSTLPTVLDTQERLERLASTPAHPDLPSALHAYARAHLAVGLRASARRDAIRHCWQASDALCALIDLPGGWASIYLFDEKREIAFGAYQGSAWSSTRHWLDALYVTIWSDRSENLSDRLVPGRAKMRPDGEPDALRSYARGLLAVLDGAPEQDGDWGTYFRRARGQLDTAGPEWAWLGARLDAWAALEHDSAAFVERLGAIAAADDPSAIDAGIGVSLEASALWALARRRFPLHDVPADPRFHLPPAG